MAKETPASDIARKEQDITGQVLARVKQMESLGDIKIPQDYSVENALKSANLYLIESTTGKESGNKPVLEFCTRASIANALLKMVTEGLSVAKNQGYFIAYGDKLTWSRSYFGSECLARRVDPDFGKVKPIIVYEGDEFEYEIDTTSGTKKVTKHIPSFENQSNDKIKGGYGVILSKDGQFMDTVIMTITEIRTAWNQGATKGQSPAHKNFTQEMAKKTIINNACKPYINTSDDSYLEDTDTSNRDQGIERPNEPVYHFDEAELVEEKPASPPMKTIQEGKEPQPASMFPEEQ